MRENVFRDATGKLKFILLGILFNMLINVHADKDLILVEIV